MSMLRGRGGPPQQKAVNFGPSLKRILLLMAPDKARMALVLVMAAIAVGLSVLAPKLLGRATDIIFDVVVGKMLQQFPPGTTQNQAVAALRASGEGQLADMLAATNVTPGQGLDLSALGAVLLLVLGLYVVAFFFNWSQGYMTTGIVQRAMYRLRRNIEEKLDRLPLAHFQQESRGDVLSRVTNDVDNFGQTLNQTLTQILISVLTVCGVLGMMFSISPLLAGISLLTLPLVAVLTVLIAKRSQVQFAAQWKSTGDLNGHVEEMFTGHEIVKAFGQQEAAIAKFKVSNDKLFESSAKAQFISGLIMPGTNFVANLNYVVIAVLGGIQVAQGVITIGSVQAFIQYSRQFSQPMAQLASMINLLQSGVASAERVFALLDAQEQRPDHSPAAQLAQPAGRVVFERVNFSYTPDKPLIKDLSFLAEPGETVAIVGPTGAGKTTLVNLLMRFYEIDTGTITIDGVDTAELTRDDVRSQFGMVLQDAWLFGGTVRENLVYGRLEATEADILEAAKATHVDHFVRSLPDGYNTVLTDDGGGLSQGQRQLMTIARAWIANPRILILDEATSSVDTRTEVMIRQAMNRLRAHRTSFVIAHRLSTIRDADLILVMDHGEIIEQGSHEQLLGSKGFYYDLYMSQFGDPMVEEAARA